MPDQGTCRSCGAPITWGLTKNGKRCPFNADGASHFGTCPQAKHWTKPKVDHVLSEAKKGDQGHVCHAADCPEHVPPAMFMCKRHWFMVPVPLRKRIWALYEPGQEITKDASPEYLEVAREAIEAVRRQQAVLLS